MARLSVAFIFFMLSLFQPGNLPREVIGMGALTITSPAFNNNEQIPKKYTCDGKDVSPPLSLGNIPPEAKSIALVVDDPDAPAGVWVHWVVWNIGTATREIVEGTVPTGAMQGRNDFGKSSYGGPCPPSGTHRYFFKVYALNTTLNLPANSSKSDVEKAMKGHVVSEGHLVGLYKRGWF